MAKHNKTSRVLLMTFMLIGFALPTLVGCKPSVRTAARLSFGLNEYYWETQEVYTFEFPNLPNSGRQQRDILVVDLTVTNESERKLPLMSWYAIDTEGNRYDSTVFNDIPFDEDISIEVIHPGEVIRGKIAFEVPADHLPLWIRCARYAAEVEVKPQP